MAIRKRRLKNGRYTYQARLPHPHPTPGRGNQDVVKTFATKREAEAWEARTKVRYADEPNHNPDRARTPFPDLVEDWRRVRFGALAPRSQARYEQILRAHLLPEFGRAKVGDISRERVRDYLAGLASQTTTRSAPDGTATTRPKYATGTVMKVRTTLSSIMSEAVERGMVTANPCHNLRGLPKDEPRKMLFLSAPEVAALADAIDPRYRTLILTAAFTGLRAGELHALRVKDVDLLRSRLTVSRALKVWRSGVPVFGPTKTDRPRSVDLAPELRDLLAAHISATHPHPTPGGAGRLPARPNPRPNPEALLFTNSEGGAVHQVAFLRNHFKPAVARALPVYAADPNEPNRQTLRFHDLRHTYISFLIAQGIHPKSIQEQAGHASVVTTMDRYGHLGPNAGERVTAALSATFAAGQQTPAVTPLRASS